jgi:2-polyprenyl-3-methyl-5-hydroxy-6-metoxy-1,4-benzoquinol methylase
MTTIDDRLATEADIDLERVEAFAHKVSADQGLGANALLAYLGDRLGIWRALAAVPAATSQELARRTGFDERYLQEWLAAQAAVGYLEYDAGTRAFRLPVEHAAVLADDDSPAAMAGPFEFIAAAWASVDRFAGAVATGEGIAWHEHDPRLWTAVERFYRPLYASSLVQEWLPAIDGVVAKLQAGARVLDVGCGYGTPTVFMAEAFPASTFTGVDSHDESIRAATAAAARAGVADRVSFRQATADAVSRDGEAYDLVCFFDALHDMGDPVGALRQAREALADGGVVFAVEPASEDALEANIDSPTGVAWFTSSFLACLPGSLSQPGAAGLGAQAGPSRMLAAFEDAGFTTARVAARTAFNLVFEARA